MTVVAWDALATLVAGLVAVAGAVHVGLKHAKILDQQRLQTDTNLRIQLLDRRSVCVSRMREVTAHWDAANRLSPEMWAQFRDALWDAELLFSANLVAEMDAALSGIFWRDHWQRRSREYNERDKADKAAEMMEKSRVEEDKVFGVMPGLLTKLKAESRVSDWA